MALQYTNFYLNFFHFLMQAFMHEKKNNWNSKTKISSIDTFDVSIDDLFDFHSQLSGGGVCSIAAAAICWSEINPNFLHLIVHRLIIWDQLHSELNSICW